MVASRWPFAIKLRKHPSIFANDYRPSTDDWLEPFPRYRRIIKQGDTPMYCNACGKTTAEDGRFCPYCGNVVGIPPSPKKLMRSRADRKIGGVCAGLARYLDLDVSLVRILWFFITLACGIFPGIVAYVLGWIIIPEEPLLLPVATSQQPVTS